MKRQNVTIVAVIVFILAAMGNYDSGNAEKRRSIIRRSSVVKESIALSQQMLERTNELRLRVDELLVTASQAKEISAKGQEIYLIAVQKKSEILTKQLEMNAVIVERIEQFNNLVEEYNRSPRPILFGKGGLPKEMTKLIKPNQAL